MYQLGETSLAGTRMPPDMHNGGARIRISTDGITLWHIPLGDLILHTELRVATEQDIHAFRCPCKDCRGGQRKRIEVIRKHHVAVGRDPFLTKSMIGGDPLDGYPPHGVWVEDVAYDNDAVDADFTNVDAVHQDLHVDDTNLDEPTANTNDPLDEYHEVQ